jgi:peptidylprolyl isomerase
VSGPHTRARAAGTLCLLAGIALLVVLSQSGGAPGRDRAGEGRAPKPPCPRAKAPVSEPGSYDAPPDPSLLEPGVDYAAVIATTCGDIEIDLLEDERPQAVANFIFLAREGFFDGLRFPRVERNFLIQTGDPNNELLDPPDGPGYSLVQEPPDDAADYVYGVVAWASTGTADTYGSQFFIIVHLLKGRQTPTVEPAGLKKHYTIFGRVAESSYNVIDAISAIDTVPGPDPLASVEPVIDVYIESVEIIER